MLPTNKSAIISWRAIVWDSLWGPKWLSWVFATQERKKVIRVQRLLQHTATLCSTLQHTAAHCNTLQHTAAHCNTLQHAYQHTRGFPFRHHAQSKLIRNVQNSGTTLVLLLLYGISAENATSPKSTKSRNSVSSVFRGTSSNLRFWFEI